MINNYKFQMLHQENRVKSKSLDSMFRRRVENGANCSPFVSDAILKQVKEVYDLNGENSQSKHGVGQIKFLAVSKNEPPGKPIEDCEKIAVFLTLDAGEEDQKIRFQHGTATLRRAKILRLATEAKEQGALLSYEDIAYRILNCGVRTVVRDANVIREHGMCLPTRGQQKDVGPLQSHKVKIIELFLQGFEYNEIGRRTMHALSSVENYITTFARVVLLADKGYCDDEIACIIRKSPALVKTYRQIYHDKNISEMAQRRIEQILEKLSPQNSTDCKKRGRI